MLKGKSALVTGSTSGIGAGIAQALAAQGANVMLNGFGDANEIGALRERLERTHGIKAIYSGADMSRPDEIQAMVAEAIDAFGGIDILVNNAGTILRKPAAEHPDEYWDEVIQTNLSSQFLLSREVGKRMLERGSGKVIFTASVLTFQGGINVPGYAASKGAIGQLTKALANEWASHGVLVNAIAPGYINTDNAAPLAADPVRGPAILSRIPTGRWGEPDDLKGAIVFLASPASDYVTGSILTVDGGWLAR